MLELQLWLAQVRAWVEKQLRAIRGDQDVRAAETREPREGDAKKPPFKLDITLDEAPKRKGRTRPPKWIKPALKWVGISLGVLVGFIILLGILGAMLGGESEPQSAYGQYGGSGMVANPMQGMTLFGLIAGFALGAGFIAIIAFWKFIAEKHGWLALIGISVVLVFIGDGAGSAGTTSVTSMLAFILGLAGGVAVASRYLLKVEPAMGIPNIFGSSRWATREDLEEGDLLGTLEDGDGLFLGEVKRDGTPIIYRGDMHALTVAPTRTGKGATAIIPNLLRSKGSILVIDPKGENARRTAAKRAAMGHRVLVVDPWGISTDADRYGPGASPEFLASFNPLEALRPDDPELPSDAMLLADALVVSSARDPFWDNEAKALVAGFILYLVIAPEEDGQRHLGRLREILSLPPSPEGYDAPLAETRDEIIIRMFEADHPLVRQAAARILQKSPKERASVFSAAQSNTHFLDGPALRENLRSSDFRFSELKASDTPTTVYLVLPLDRISVYNRWLRLLITSAMIDLTRTPGRAGAEPVRVILDEFAALEKLSFIETAFGTMAGLGVQLWVVTQDLAQLSRLYGDKGWQTFISNAGVFQYFGSRDTETAEYASRLTGMTTLRKRSVSFSTSASQAGSSSSSNTNYDDIQRALALPDELMTLHRDLQLLFVENHYPIVARKRWWFRHVKEEAASATAAE